ncbi:MAG: diacylglycerol kinase family lipid kinase [Gemmataceae bacterium]|nr:diacylglycerol kinase family lipid kinase [Gemmataceae bacterium]
MTAAAVCVIFNPMAGRGRATRQLERLRKHFGGAVDLRPTDAAGHGDELAFKAVREGFDHVAAAGGDGTVHEVANGILRAGRPEVVFHLLPVGSANDFAHAVEREQAASPGTSVRRVDVGLARRGDGLHRYFVNGLGLGFNGAVTLESRKIRWLRGVPLYALALIRALRHRFECPEMTVVLDDQTRQVPTLALTVALGRREGGFVLAPDALLTDGLFDYVQAGALRRWELLRYLPQMVTGRLPTDHPQLWTGRCRTVQVESPTALTVHLDGEFLCQAADDVHQIDVTLLPAALAVQVERFAS